jgi:hypothetical protein
MLRGLPASRCLAEPSHFRTKGITGCGSQDARRLRGAQKLHGRGAKTEQLLRPSIEGTQK